MNSRHGGPLPSDQQVGVRGASEGSSPELGTKAEISWEKRREGFGGGKEREAGNRKAKGGQEAPAQRATLL